MAGGHVRNGDSSSRRSRHVHSSPKIVFRFIVVGIVIVNCNIFLAAMYLLKDGTSSHPDKSSYVRPSRALRPGISIQDQTRILGEEAVEKIIARGADADVVTPTRPKLLASATSRKKLAEKNKPAWKFPSIVETAAGKDENNNTLWEIIPERHWWNSYIGYASRAYPMYDGENYDWCIPEKHHTPKWIKDSTQKAFGLLYVKPYMVAPSLGEGVNINIAHHVGRRIMSKKSDSKIKNHTSSNITSRTEAMEHPSVAARNAPPCTHYNSHQFSDHKNQGSRSSPSLLWSLVRKPTERDLAELTFQHVSRKKVTPTDDHVMRILAGIKNRQVRYLTPHWSSVRKLDHAIAKFQNHSPHHANSGDETRNAQIAKIIKKDIIEYYDFIGIIERIGE